VDFVVVTLTTATSRMSKPKDLSLGYTRDERPSASSRHKGHPDLHVHVVIVVVVVVVVVVVDVVVVVVVVVVVDVVVVVVVVLPVYVVVLLLHFDIKHTV